MKLNMFLLAYALDQFNPIIHSNDSHSLHLRNLHVLNSWQWLPQAGTVYLTTPSQLLNYEHKENLTDIICIGGEKKFFNEFKNLRYILLKEDIPLSVVIEAINTSFEYFDQIELEFLKALIKRIEIDEIMAIITRFFRNPTFYFDTSLTAISIVDHFEHHFIDRVKWDSTVANGHVSTQTLNFFKNSHPNTAFFLESQFENYYLEQIHFISAPLLHNNEQLFGYLVIGDDFTEMNDGYLGIADFVAAQISEVLFQKNQERIIEYSSLEVFFCNMLEGVKGNDSYILTTISPLGWKLTDYYCVCVIPLSKTEIEGEFENYGIKSIKNAITDNGYSCFYFVHQNEQIFIINMNKSMELPLSLVRSLEKLLKIRSTCAGFSSIMKGIYDIDSLYILSKEAIRIGLTNPEHKYVHLYSLLCHVHFFDFKQKPQNMLTVCDAKILELSQIDNEKDTQYIRSLYIYLMNERSLKIASSELFIHRNSLVYRLEKINEFLSYNLDDPFMRMKILMSCKIILMHKRNESDLKYLFSH